MLSGVGRPWPGPIGAAVAAFLFLAFEDLQKKLWGAGSGEVLSSDAWHSDAFCVLSSVGRPWPGPIGAAGDAGVVGRVMTQVCCGGRPSWPPPAGAAAVPEVDAHPPAAITFGP